VATRKLVDTLRFAIPGVQEHLMLPCGIRFTPDGKTAVVALGRANHVALVDVATRKVRAFVPVGKRVWHVAVSADGAKAYSANGLSDSVSVIDLASAKVVGTVPVGTAPWGIVAVP
jgi:YVTN family beta-propeller protein